MIGTINFLKKTFINAYLLRKPFDKLHSIIIIIELLTKIHEEFETALFLAIDFYTLLQMDVFVISKITVT